MENKATLLGLVKLVLPILSNERLKMKRRNKGIIFLLIIIPTRRIKMTLILTILTINYYLEWLCLLRWVSR